MALDLRKIVAIIKIENKNFKIQSPFLPVRVACAAATFATGILKNTNYKDIYVYAK
jgi:hypothetical protein